MYTTINTPALQGSTSIIRSRNASILTRFFSWAEGQSEARFIWLGIALLAHASFLTPFTVMAVMLTSNSFPLIMTALAAMGLALVTNLAALPTKVTVPAFFLSILIDITIVALTFLVF